MLLCRKDFWWPHIACLSCLCTAWVGGKQCSKQLWRADAVSGAGRNGMLLLCRVNCWWWNQNCLHVLPLCCLGGWRTMGRATLVLMRRMGQAAAGPICCARGLYVASDRLLVLPLSYAVSGGMQSHICFAAMPECQDCVLGDACLQRLKLDKSLVALVCLNVLSRKRLSLICRAAEHLPCLPSSFAVTMMFHMPAGVLAFFVFCAMPLPPMQLQIRQHQPAHEPAHGKAHHAPSPGHLLRWRRRPYHMVPRARP